ncbi:hypothetical protein [Brevundimonas sp. M20]|uniref:acyl-CoA-like ligand-binding transcription factor n=1 Tax=Brevundimonas sp. M20 TaxID=2591463 RepID=UPI00143D2336
MRRSPRRQASRGGASSTISGPRKRFCSPGRRRCRRRFARACSHGPPTAPLDAARDALFGTASRYDRLVERLIARLVGASERVQAGRLSGLMRLEQALADSLNERWPEPAQATRLAFVAMAAVGALRLAIDRWVAHPDAQTLRHHLQAVFEASGRRPSHRVETVNPEVRGARPSRTASGGEGAGRSAAAPYGCHHNASIIIIK